MAFDPNGNGNPKHYDLVLIGGGYSIATYLLMAELTWAQRIAILGGPDAWSRQLRGDGIVNHAQFLVDPRFTRRLEVEQQAIDRPTFLATNQAVFAAALGGLAANRPVVWTDGTTRASQPPVVQFGGGGLDGSAPFLVTAVTPRVDSTAAPIRRGVSVGAKGSLAPALDVAQGAPLCVFDIAFKPYGQTGPADLANPTVITAMKVVFGGGAGPHAVPPWARKYVGFADGVVSYGGGEQVVDLDSFMRRYGRVDPKAPQLAGKTVVVVGPNAGVDAAVTALEQGADLKWLIRGPAGTKPFWIPTNHYALDFPALQARAHRAVLNYQEGGERQIALSGQSGGPYTVDLSNTIEPVAVAPNAEPSAVYRLDPSIFRSLTGGARKIAADIVVYAVSQDAGLTEKIDGRYTRIGPLALLANNHNAGPSKNVRGAIPASLVPIFDINQRFGPPSQTVVGLATRMAWNATDATFVDNLTQLDDLMQRRKPTYRVFRTDRYRGLELVGAAVAAMWRSAVAVEEIARQGGTVNIGTGIANLAKALRQQSLVTADQLSTLRSAIEASTGADFRSQVETMTGFEAAAANYRDAATAVLKKSSAQQEQRGRTRQLQQTASLLLLALSPAAPGAYRELYRQGRVALTKALGSKAPAGEDEFVLATWIAEWCVSLVSSRATAFLGSGTGYDTLQAATAESLKPLDDITPAIISLLKHAPADYNGMDQTALAVLIATRYPHILPDAWEAITGKIIRQRSEAGAWGYNRTQLQSISYWLVTVDGLSQPLMTAQTGGKPPAPEALEALAAFMADNPRPYLYLRSRL